MSKENTHTCGRRGPNTVLHTPPPKKKTLHSAPVYTLIANSDQLSQVIMMRFLFSKLP